jgi:putative ABC transport system permease protein
MRQLFKIFNVSFQAINRNRTRSFLTVLGIIIGVAAVIMTISAGEGARMAVSKEISGLGNNIVMINVKTEHRGGLEVRMGKEMNKKDFEIIIKNSVWMPNVSPVVAMGAQAVGGTGYKTTTLYGTSNEYFEILSRKIVSGESFSEADVHAARKVCLIGETVRTELFTDGDVLGKQLRIDKVPFTIVGVLDEQGKGPMGQDQDDLVIAPYTTVQNRLSGSINYDMIIGGALSEDHVAEAKQEVIELIRESHKLQDNEPDDFDVTTQVELQEITGQVTGTLTILLGAVASVSLIVGGIGIMNIMLVSVTERTREIGIRLALGARESDILTQFLIEAIVLSATGGALGIVLGVVGNQVIFKATGFFVPTVSYSILIGFGFSALVGIAFGYFPARKAAKLNPIEALRYE